MEIKDYARPTMEAERCLKDLHDAVLDKRWDDAYERSREVVRWVFEIQEALHEMRARDEA